MLNIQDENQRLMNLYRTLQYFAKRVSHVVLELCISEGHELIKLYLEEQSHDIHCLIWPQVNYIYTARSTTMITLGFVYDNICYTIDNLINYIIDEYINL